MANNLVTLSGRKPLLEGISLELVGLLARTNSKLVLNTISKQIELTHNHVMLLTKMNDN